MLVQGWGWHHALPQWSPPYLALPWPRSDITAAFVSAPAEHQLAQLPPATGEQAFVLRQPSSSRVLLVGLWFTLHVIQPGNRMLW